MKFIGSPGYGNR